MYRSDRRAGVCRLHGPATRWLSAGFDGGYAEGTSAYNVTVPEGFDRTDLATYARERRREAEFDDGPTLLTGVEQQHARGTRLDSVTAVATAGVSNPAGLPMDPDGEPAEPNAGDTPPNPGTVNVLLATTRRLPDGALASLLALVAETKAATLLHETGVPGTTSDAVIVGSARDGDPAQFAGSATAVGRAARACVREAVRESLASRYADTALPKSVADAEYGVETTVRAAVFDPSDTPK
ncbi:adenosylcobinamide amidohydrolase [Halosegnis longus]|uniref:Adenosylcobinamide amidohydrolase n=1 Tax=Halosegnis longus TaxID=2216012 RepID=A0AAJ4R7A6_9EURY|nr:MULTISPECIES: adenosylcobinamide amidohydrolase [Halobacteriales]RNJ25572.1 adenosylcobinamide amidohydrolase [Salella cibi]